MLLTITSSLESAFIYNSRNLAIVTWVRVVGATLYLTLSNILLHLVR